MQYVFAMKLKDYLKQEDLTLKAFAERAGIDISTVHRAAEGKLIPLSATLIAIAEASDGAVQPNDFFDIAAAQ